MKKISILFIALILVLGLVPCYAESAEPIVLPAVSLTPSPAEDTAPDASVEDASSTVVILPAEDGSAPADGNNASAEDAILKDDDTTEKAEDTYLPTTGNIPNADANTTPEIDAAEVDESQKTERTFFFEPVNFVKTLDKMGIGMIGIFIVIGIIILATVVLNKCFREKAPKQE